MRRRDLATSKSWAPQASEGKKKKNNPSPEANFISARDTPATTGSAPRGCHLTAAASANGPAGRAGAGGPRGQGRSLRLPASGDAASRRGLASRDRQPRGAGDAASSPAAPRQAGSGAPACSEALPPRSPGRRGPPRGWASRSSRRGDRPRRARRLRCPPGAGAPSEAPKGVGHSPTQADPRRRR